MDLHLGLLIAAIVLFIVSAVPFDKNGSVTNAGLACFAASFLF